MEDDHGPLVRVETAEAALELVAIGEVEGGVGFDPRPARLTDLRFDRPPTSSPPRFAIAGTDEEAVDPGVEAVGIAQGREVAPGGDERLLGGVLGPLDRRAGSDRRWRRAGRSRRAPTPRTRRDRPPSPVGPGPAASGLRMCGTAHPAVLTAYGAAHRRHGSRKVRRTCPGPCRQGAHRPGTGQIAHGGNVMAGPRWLDGPRDAHPRSRRPALERSGIQLRPH